ncbi:MAG: hypothetical protein IBX60_01385 [Candidatus Aminicenantes bacterium]|nr:hypothetical protein [Candidatus Aminicenantes bacterium]
MAVYNTEVEHKGTIFHVQTQDKGLGVNYIESIIYKSGRVISSRKTFYTAFLGSPNLKEKITQVVKDQHEATCKEISSGKFDHL